MKSASHILCAMLSALCISSCSDDMQDEQDGDRPMAFGVSASWREGKSIQTRSISDDLMSGTDNIGISYENYPQKLIVQVDNQGHNEFTPFYISKPDAKTECALSHPGYYRYEQIGYDIYYVHDYEDNNYRFSAWGTIDGEPSTAASASIANTRLWDNIPAFGFCDYLYCRFADMESRHILFDLKHATAMMRFYYSYSAKYAKVRNIVLRNAKINLLGPGGLSKEYTLDMADRSRFTPIDGEDGLLLSTTPQAFCYVYANPELIKVGASSTLLSLECTYDIYDDEAFDAEGHPIANLGTHCTRKAVKAVSTPFSLKSASISSFEAGKYYDLSITINPDYLYVLSEHDNEPVTVK